MSFGLIETFRWEQEAGFIRLDRHLKRLKKSAEDLSFVSEINNIEERLEKSIEGNSPLRVRIELQKNGDFDVQTFPFVETDSDYVFKLGIATTRIDSENDLLLHKTTKREIYQAARDEYPAEKADEVLLLNERDQVCEGAITNLFIRRKKGGLLETPALKCGLLPGVLRSEFLDKGLAAETVLEVQDVKEAEEIYVGNSLRGFIRSELID